MAIGDLELAEEVFHKGLNYPTMFMYVEKARLLAGSALLALARGQLDEAAQLVEEALAYAKERYMQNMYPLIYLTRGKILARRNEVDAALESFAEAEARALDLNMRPYLWQSRLAAAEALQSAGRENEVGEKRDSAKAVVEEIAGLFEDQELRSTYLQGALEKVGV